MFIGRERELSALERMYRSERFQFAVLYGRRRVGKTALLNRFIEGKRAIYFMGVESSARQNLVNFSAGILAVTGYGESEAVFPSFQSALEAVFQAAEKERLILVIDEYPYVAHAEKSLASTLQMLIDRYHENSRLMLILCGSSMSYMEDQVLAYKSPLYGRRTAQMKLEPFDFAEVCTYLSGFAPEEKALLYGVIGGTPQYLLQVEKNMDVADNIKNIYLNPVSFLFEEPTNLLKQEVREPALYTAIITAIASGASRMSEITGKVGEDSNTCAVYIKNLVSLGILQKETPYGEKESRRSVYALCDNMFRFWYRFVPDNISMITRGAVDMVYNRIEPRLTEYMGKVFEDISMQYLWKEMLSGNCPVSFVSLGRWWGTDAATKSQVEIDMMGEENKETALFGECKWKNEKTDLDVLETLVHRSKLFPYKNVYYYLFSRSGFTTGCRDRAVEMGNVRLVSYADMFH